MNFKPIPDGIVQTEESQESKIDKQIRQLLLQESSCRWEQGKLFYEKRMIFGASDQDMAEEFDLPRQAVQERRRVWEESHALRDQTPNLSWSHHRTCLSWRVAEDCLRWANRNKATIQQMCAWKPVAERFNETYREELRLPDEFFQVAVEWENAEAWLEWAQAAQCNLGALIQYREKVLSERDENDKTEPTEKVPLGEEAKQLQGRVLEDLKSMSKVARKLKREIDELANSGCGLDQSVIDKLRKKVFRSIEEFRTYLSQQLEEME